VVFDKPESTRVEEPTLLCNQWGQVSDKCVYQALRLLSEFSHCGASGFS